MEDSGVDIVTGAFSYTGSSIARRLLAQGRKVVTLTGHATPESPLYHHIRAYPYDFDSPSMLVDHLRGASTLYNTYWIRFPRGTTTFAQAVENTRTLITAARAAGVRRIVHISVTNASPDAPLPYFRGKGVVEEMIKVSGLSYALVRPALTFGEGDILVNNIAWFLRRFPLFCVPGDGSYRLQPACVEDVAELAVKLSQEQENVTVDAVGPETYTFDGLVKLIAKSIQSKARLLHVPPRLALLLASLVGHMMQDVALTGEEIEGLMAGLLTSQGPATCPTPFSQWLEEHGHILGKQYRSEVARHFR